MEKWTLICCEVGKTHPANMTIIIVTIGNQSHYWYSHYSSPRRLVRLAGPDQNTARSKCILRMRDK